MNWDFKNAKKLCQQLELLVSPLGAHVALTGGVLYKQGLRKDVDILFYPDGCATTFNRHEILDAIDEHKDFEILEVLGRVVKARAWGIGNIDFFFLDFDMSVKQAPGYGDSNKIRINSFQDLYMNPVPEYALYSVNEFFVIENYDDPNKFTICDVAGVDPESGIHHEGDTFDSLDEAIKECDNAAHEYYL
jgi:hypothetical protein